VEQRDSLIAALAREDQLLRRCIARCGPQRLEQSGRAGSLSPKEVFGHLAYWDDYTVDFFASRLDGVGEGVPPPRNFEQLSRCELARIARLPFAEVERCYARATERLLEFLRRHWSDISPRQRHDFRVPLRHRRHHRQILEASLMDEEPPQAHAGTT
jgi:hypothetical protein